jgi:hypothetical protein
LLSGGDTDFECACAAGPACTVNEGTAPAPVGVTLAPDTWSGQDCYPVPCVEIAGVPYAWPDSCQRGRQ